MKKRGGRRQKEHGRLKVSGVKGDGRGRGVAMVEGVVVKIKNKKNGDGGEKERKKREGEDGRENVGDERGKKSV